MANTSGPNRELDEQGPIPTENDPEDIRIQDEPSIHIYPEIVEKKTNTDAGSPNNITSIHDEPPIEPLSEQQAQISTPPGEDFSVLTATQKKWIIMTASLASLFSPMATAIYCSPTAFAPFNLV